MISSVRIYCKPTYFKRRGERHFSSKMTRKSRDFVFRWNSPASLAFRLLMINKLSINNTHANLLHQKLIKRNLNFNEWMHKLKKNKVMCEINSFAIVYFFFDDRLFNNKLCGLKVHLNTKNKRNVLVLKFRLT